MNFESERENMTTEAYDGEQELSTKSRKELVQLKETLDRQLTDLAIAGVEVPSELLMRFERIQAELAHRQSS